MSDVTAIISEVLEKGNLMSLATMDESGVWVADVVYVYDDDLNIYWMSDSEVRHSRAIAKDARVAGSITASARGERNFGVQFSGEAKRLDGERYDCAKKLYAKQRKPEPKETDDVLEGDSWYVLRLSRVDVICEEQFGFSKRSIER